MKPAVIHSGKARRRAPRGILTITTLGALGLGLLATSYTGKELMFQARCQRTELANELAPREPALAETPPGDSSAVALAHQFAGR